MASPRVSTICADIWARGREFPRSPPVSDGKTERATGPRARLPPPRRWCSCCCNARRSRRPPAAATPPACTAGERTYRVSDGWVFARAARDVSAELAPMTVAGALAHLASQGIDATPIQTLRELVDRHRARPTTTVAFEKRERDGWENESFAPTWYAFDGVPNPRPAAPPRIGSDATEILAALGYTAGRSRPAQSERHHRPRRVVSSGTGPTSSGLTASASGANVCADDPSASGAGAGHRDLVVLPGRDRGPRPRRVVDHPADSHGVECTCGHGLGAICPMHHKPADDPAACGMKAANTGTAVLTTLIGTAGLVAEPTRSIQPPTPSIYPRAADVHLAGERPVPPDPPPPRA